MEGTPMARTSFGTRVVVLLVVATFPAGLAGAASSELADEAGKERMKLGIQGKVVDIGFGNGIGVDALGADFPASQMGVQRRSFVYRIEVQYGDNKVDKRRTDSFDAVQKALGHENISKITLVWRKNNVWYKNSYDVQKKLYGKATKIDKPDE
jgi:hypothetical protein